MTDENGKNGAAPAPKLKSITFKLPDGKHGRTKRFTFTEAQATWEPARDDPFMYQIIVYKAEDVGQAFIIPREAIECIHIPEVRRTRIAPAPPGLIIAKQ